MLRIRPEQLAVFEDRSMRAFVTRVVEHVSANFPDACRALDPKALRLRVESAIAEARRFDLESERDLCVFADLDIALGAGFCADPALPWAIAILEDPMLTQPSDRLDKLHERALAYLREGESR